MGNAGKQTYNTKYYDLDMIISIGFRVNSKKAIKFRTWANKIIKDYMVQGFALNDERFMKVRKSMIRFSFFIVFLSGFIKRKYQIEHSIFYTLF